MATRDQVYIDIVADAKQSIASFAKLAAGIGGAVVVIKKIADATKVWIDAASKAEEINSKFATTFDDMSASSAMAASNLAKNYGLAESSAKDLLSATGDMLIGFGATDAEALSLSSRVQTLAVDLASFTNYSGGAKGASEALTKGLLGERESMKSLGIAINEADVQQRLFEKGQHDLEGQALKMAKAEATLELAYEQSKNAIGDYARTQDSYANVARRSEEVTKALREEMGERLMPAAGTLQGAILSVKEQMLELMTATNDLNEALGKEAAGQVLNYTDQVALAKQETTELVTSMFELGSGKLSLGNMKNLVMLIREGKDGVAEMAEEQEKNLAAVEKQYEIIREAEQITDTWVTKSADKADADKRARDYIQQQNEKIEQQLALLASAEKSAAMKLKNSDNELLALEAQRYLLYEQEKEYAKIIEAGREEGKNMDFVAAAYRETYEERLRILDAMEEIRNKSNEIGEEEEERNQEFYNAWIERENAKQEKLSEAHSLKMEQLEEEREAQKEYDEYIQETQERFIELEEEKQEKAREAAEKTFSVLSGGFGAIGNLSKSMYEQQMQDISETEKEAIEALNKQEMSEKEYGEAKKQIMEEYDAKRKEIQRQQAIDEKAMAMFQAAIAAAAAVVKALPNIPLSIAAGVIGGIQIAAIAAEPIPAAATGADFETAGPQLLMVGDNPGGRERVQVTPLSSENVNGPSGATHITVMLDSAVLMDAIGRASRDGRLIIDGKAVRS